MYFVGLCTTSRGATKEPFIEWMLSHADEIKNGTAVFEGNPVDLNSQIVRYQSVFSFLVLSHKQYSSFGVVGDSRCQRQMLLSTLLTALCGWWSLQGIFVAFTALLINLTGGQRKTVAQLFKDVEYGSIIDPVDWRRFWGPVGAIPAFYFVAMFALCVYRLFVPVA